MDGISKINQNQSERKIIETTIWKQDPKYSCIVHFVGTRKVFDVFNELVEILKANDMMPDEYFILDSTFNEYSEIPACVNFYAYACWGGSEGVYLDVIMASDGGHQHFATGKTLGETEADYDRMNTIAGFIHKTFTGFGRAKE